MSKLFTVTLMSVHSLQVLKDKTIGTFLGLSPVMSYYIIIIITRWLPRTVLTKKSINLNPRKT